MVRTSHALYEGLGWSLLQDALIDIDKPVRHLLGGTGPEEDSGEENAESAAIYSHLVLGLPGFLLASNVSVGFHVVARTVTRFRHPVLLWFPSTLFWRAGSSIQSRTGCFAVACLLDFVPEFTIHV